MPGIEEQDAEAFNRVGSVVRQQVQRRVPGRREPRARRIGDGQRPPPELDGGKHPARLNGSHSRYADELLATDTRETTDPAGQAEHLAGQDQRVTAAASVPDEHGQQFVVAERAGAVAVQLLSRPIVRGEFVHRISPDLTANAKTAALYSSPMRRRFAAVLVLAAAACSAPPDNERHQAEGAITAARAADAPTYAPATLAAAEEALSRYDMAVAQRDYREALRLAVEARDSGYQATREAANEKAIQRGRAERLTAEVTAALDVVRRQPPAAAARHRAWLTDAEQALQEARTVFERQDYRQVVARLEPILARFQGDSTPPGTSPPAGSR